MRRTLVAAFAGATAAACADAARTVVVYTPLSAEVSAWARGAFEAAHPGMRVRFEEVRGAEALARLGSERDAPVADAWWGAPSWELARGAGEGLLARSAPPWTAAVPDAMRDPRGRWTGVVADPLVLAFDPDRVARSRAPADWIHLFHPRWAGELLLLEPGPSDAMSALLAQRIVRAAGDPREDVALDWFARLDAARGAYVPDAADGARRLGRGEGMVAVLPLSAAERARASGEGVEYRVPESGTPVVVRGIALVAGAPHPEAAAAFLAWAGSARVGAELAARFALLPAAAPPAGAGPDWAAAVRGLLRPDVLPADTVAAHLDGWVARWRAEVRGRTNLVF